MYHLQQWLYFKGFNSCKEMAVDYYYILWDWLTKVRQPQGSWLHKENAAKTIMFNCIKLDENLTDEYSWVLVVYSYSSW